MKKRLGDRSRYRYLRWVAIPVLLTFLSMACGGDGAEPLTPDVISPTSASTPTTEPTQVSSTSGQEESGVVDLIAYVGLDDNIYTIRPDGSDRQQLTVPTSGETASLVGSGLLAADTVNNWPTWSPDATKIAFTSFSAAGDTSGALYVAEAPGGLPKKIYQDPPEMVGRFVATRSPHYIYWSPNGETLAFLAPSDRNLTLFLIKPDGLDEPRPVAFGAPSYMSWSPDGRYLLLHLQGDLALVDTLGDLSRSVFTAQSFAFRAPSWAPDNQRIAYIDRLNGANGLKVADRTGANQETIATVEELGVFLWSPSANELGFTTLTTNTGLGVPTYDGLTVFDADTMERYRITDSELLSYFWSPDGTKLAYVAVDRDQSIISWYVSDNRGNTQRKLSDFIPSRETIFTLFAFFDQYAYSNSLWSPDSKSLVYVGKDVGSNGAGVDKVFVVGVDGGTPPRVIAEGNLAFWSPR